MVEANFQRKKERRGREDFKEDIFEQEKGNKFQQERSHSGFGGNVFKEEKENEFLQQKRHRGFERDSFSAKMQVDYLSSHPNTQLSGIEGNILRYQSNKRNRQQQFS